MENATLIVVFGICRKVQSMPVSPFWHSFPFALLVSWTDNSHRQADVFMVVNVGGVHERKIVRRFTNCRAASNAGSWAPGPI